jgi:hypothetical protein
MSKVELDKRSTRTILWKCRRDVICLLYHRKTLRKRNNDTSTKESNERQKEKIDIKLIFSRKPSTWEIKEWVRPEKKQKI